MTRNLSATKEAILDAAEAAFADHGYDGASLQKIASAAGVSRGMPGYAFGSKEALYDAVLERAFALPRALVTDLADRRATDPPEAVAAAIEAYVDFLAGHPAYVRLLQRAALDGSDRLSGSPANASALVDALAGAGEALGSGGFRPVDPRHLVVSVLGLCFFPFAHQHTLLRPLGLDVDDPEFRARYTAHVVDLLLHGLLADGLTADG